VLRPAGSPLQGADDFHRFPIRSNYHRGSYTSPALAAASYPLVDLPPENNLLCKLLPASKFDESAHASSGISRNVIYSKKFEIAY